jgi:opacity protein-like surface antigen
MRRLVLAVFVLLVTSTIASAQEERRLFAGLVLGVSTLSADSRSVTNPPEAQISLYKPENGPAVNVFAGYHLSRFFSLQANYVWNRNDLSLVSSLVTPAGGGFYEQDRRSAQHAFVADALLYFRRLGSGIRPYLGTGLAIVHFDGSDVRRTTSSGLSAPEGTITATKVALRSHVGIDLALSRRLSFRYSFSETIGGNPVSSQLTPAGKRGLANFQNLFGLVAGF